jgi:uncharacterized protein (DUF885 family)
VLDRRQFLATATGSLVAACATTPPPSKKAPANREVAFNELLDQFVNEILAKNPEQLTSLALDKGQYAWTKSRLNDGSIGRRHESRQENADRLRRLKAFGRDALSGPALANYDTVEFQMETAARAARFDYGGEGVRPYVVNQLSGAYQSIPTFLDRQHTIESREDADAYIARLQAFAVLLDQETERVKRDGAGGVVPPDFIIARTVQQVRALRAATPAASILTTSVATRTRKKAIDGDYERQAARIVETEVYPALDRQAAAIEQLSASAVHEAGVRRLPDGEAFYQATLRQYTTTEMTAEDIYRLGTEQAKALSSQMDAILRSQSLTQGTVGERMQALGKDPKYLYPNTDAGRQEILDYCNGRIRALQPHLPAYFGILPKAPVEIRRVPPYTEAGAPGGYYQRPALDGSRPGAFYINLRDTAERPRWALPTLTYHESAPGHHFQLALVLEMQNLPLIRKTGSFSANTEGWALYAEQLCDEMGLYKDDPLGKLGCLQASIFRAARCVVDTGLHTRGWSREQAIDYMVETTGDNRAAMTSEVERYCSNPGQATSYKVGHIMWLRLREQARAKLGTKFDIRAFHDAGLTAAPMPLSVLERVIHDWASTQGQVRVSKG